MAFLPLSPQGGGGGNCDGSPSSSLPSPIPRLRFLPWRAVDLPPALTNKLKSPEPTHKPSSWSVPPFACLYTPHLVPCHGCVLCSLAQSGCLIFELAFSHHLFPPSTARTLRYQFHNCPLHCNLHFSLALFGPLHRQYAAFSLVLTFHLPPLLYAINGVLCSPDWRRLQYSNSSTSKSTTIAPTPPFWPPVSSP